MTYDLYYYNAIFIGSVGSAVVGGGSAVGSAVVGGGSVGSIGSAVGSAVVGGGSVGDFQRIT